MQNTVEHQANRRGPVTLNVKTVAADVQAVTDERAGSAWVELTAVDGDDNAVKIIQGAEFREVGGEIFLDLREDKLRGGGMSYGNVQVGRNFGSVVMNGVSMINGVSMGRVLVRAILPPGSQLDVNATSGDVEAKGVEQLNVRTVSGDILAEGLSQDSNLNTVSGDIEVSVSGFSIGGQSTSTALAVPNGGPRVNANTVSGNVTSYGVRLRARTVSGHIRER